MKSRHQRNHYLSKKFNKFLNKNNNPLNKRIHVPDELLCLHAQHEKLLNLKRYEQHLNTKDSKQRSPNPMTQTHQSRQTMKKRFHPLITTNSLPPFKKNSILSRVTTPGI
jgi:hypothetical protein